MILSVSAIMAASTISVDGARCARLVSAFAALFIAVGAGARALSNQESTAPAAKNVDDRAERLREMRDIASSFQAVTIDRGNRVPAAMAADPLYRWNDPTREFSDGTLWFWNSSGRPIGVVAIELYPQNKAFGTVWALEFTSLATRPIEVEGGKHFDRTYTDLYPPRADGRLRWAPPNGETEFREIAGSAVPAATDAERLRQMREIIKRFSARELFNSQEYSLRLIPHPIDRYADSAWGLIDGAIFLYANGTNPELLLMLEARSGPERPATWTYAGAPLARAVVTLRLDRQDVWSHKSEEVPTPQDTYFLARKPRKRPAHD
jgi:hypothetical protein